VFKSDSNLIFKFYRIRHTPCQTASIATRW